MHSYTTNPVIRDAINRAHAERNAAFREFFAALFARKDRHVTTATQAA